MTKINSGDSVTKYQAKIRLWGMEPKGIVVRDMIVPLKDHKTFDEYRNNLMYATWEAMRIAKEEFGMYNITDTMLRELI